MVYHYQWGGVHSGISLSVYEEGGGAQWYITISVRGGGGDAQWYITISVRGGGGCTLHSGISLSVYEGGGGGGFTTPPLFIKTKIFEFYEITNEFYVSMILGFDQ